MTQYQIDATTLSLLEEVLNMAQRTVDCQYDTEIADSMQLVLAWQFLCISILNSENVLSGVDSLVVESQLLHGQDHTT